MRRFFLHVRDWTSETLDNEGQEFADIEAARAEAIAGIRSMLCAELAEGRMDLRASVDIEDSEGKLVLSVPYAEAVSIIS